MKRLWQKARRLALRNETQQAETWVWLGLRAILADYSNGDKAVIHQVLGYTTLLQPQKTVTQAAALGDFGNSGQGVSAGNISVGDLGEVDGNKNIGG